MRFAFFNLFIIVVFVLFANSFSQTNTEANSNSPDIAQLRSEVALLRSEVSQLKSEVQQLRRLLATTPQSNMGNSTPKYNETKSDTIINDAVTGYWLTKSSNKRHNASCRYYKTSNGHPCGPNDGIPCKLCGG